MKKLDPCTQARQLLEPFMDGELPAHEQELVKAELATCSACRAEYERLTKMRALVREVYLEEVRSADLDDVLFNVMQRVEQEPKGLVHRFKAWFERYQLGLASPVAALGVAATAAVILMTATLVYVSSRGENTGPVPSMMATSDSADVQGEDQESESDQGGTTVAMEASATEAAALAPLPKSQRPNESFVTYYTAENGTVVIDSDPEGEAPTVLWHFQEENPEAAPQEDGQI